jgi:hypothetical protein
MPPGTTSRPESRRFSVPLFVGFLLGVVLIITLLQSLPALALGPMAAAANVVRTMRRPMSAHVRAMGI